MKIRTRMARAIAGTAFAGLAALAVGTAAPAGAQQVKTSPQAVSVATSHGCWDEGCGWDDGGDSWDSWGGGWDSWYSNW
jgi:invasion protein IalB